MTRHETEKLRVAPWLCLFFFYAVSGGTLIIAHKLMVGLMRIALALRIENLSYYSCIHVAGFFFCKTKHWGKKKKSVFNHLEISVFSCSCTQALFSLIETGCRDGRLSERGFSFLGLSALINWLWNQPHAFSSAGIQTDRAPLEIHRSRAPYFLDQICLSLVLLHPHS